MKLDHKQVMRALPHSYPFLLVDRVLDCSPGKHITAVKNVTCNEPFFMGHFPSNPVMPGVLIVEALAQASMLCVVCDDSGVNIHPDKSVFFMSIDSAKFRKVVVPGDVLVLKSSLSHRRGQSCRFECNAYVEDVLVSEAQILAMIN
ncbi:3-hydroxyacyl-ACP dehydratase FabZ [Candidatus Anaplasma sp. TIGMIC]|uniref:3-hydroxyacyl-ACP dehydratase FabZ n=1 Tax=Candidatus Anaplasma sp. TIGMIC TaxID=3020713 RepID=UPI00232EA4D8|nr:3-hydroxyacyl-ACP dehydratase FabZ [Candidatus Anaplasma sp. TIGMIC]MDB1135312.1 3-hydroxyacyl-ACP dehydratase FabZ [Candidatus Anaplasma sp. TIGMIC]